MVTFEKPPDDPVPFEHEHGLLRGLQDSASFRYAYEVQSKQIQACLDEQVNKIQLLLQEHRDDFRQILFSAYQNLASETPNLGGFPYQKPASQTLSPDRCSPDVALQAMREQGMTGPTLHTSCSQKESPCTLGPDSDAQSEDEEETVITLKEDASLAAVFVHDNNLETLPYCVMGFYHKTGMWQYLARSPRFEQATLLVVVLNAAYIGVDSDYNRATNTYEAAWPFLIASQFFCSYFTWELLVRFLAFQDKSNVLRDGWFKFDMFLVFTMVLDTWVIAPALMLVGGSMTIPTQPLRILRLLKLSRMARLMKAFPELVTMIKALMRALRAISSSLILIGLMVYVWGIMCHMLMKDEAEFNAHFWTESSYSFETITKSIWTLLMAGTLMLDDASLLMSDLIFHKSYSYVACGMLVGSFMFLSAMLFLQMLIGVLCDVVATVGREQRDATAIGVIKQELLADLQQFGSGDGKITQAGLQEVMNNRSSRAVLKKLNINQLFLVELQRVLFADKPGAKVRISEILDLLIICRGEQVTTVEALAGGLLSVITTIADAKRTLQSEIALIRNSIEGVKYLPFHEL